MQLIIGMQTIVIKGRDVICAGKVIATFPDRIRESSVKTCADGDCFAIITEDRKGVEAFMLHVGRRGKVTSYTIQLAIPPGVESLDEFLVSKEMLAIEAEKPDRLVCYHLPTGKQFDLPIPKGTRISNLTIQNRAIVANAAGNRTRAVPIGALPSFA